MIEPKETNTRTCKKGNYPLIYLFGPVIKNNSLIKLEILMETICQEVFKVNFLQFKLITYWIYLISGENTSCLLQVATPPSTGTRTFSCGSWCTMDGTGTFTLRRPGGTLSSAFSVKRGRPKKHLLFLTNFQGFSRLVKNIPTFSYIFPGLYYVGKNIPAFSYRFPGLYYVGKKHSYFFLPISGVILRW